MIISQIIVILFNLKMCLNTFISCTCIYVRRPRGRKALRLSGYLLKIKNLLTYLLIVMGFAKAFHEVPHKQLLYKLDYYGIRNNTLLWIQDFLSLRSQTVLLEGIHSNRIPVTSGVPQGTVLGPILFLLYINDFHEYLKYSTLRLFADDSIIYRNIKTDNDTTLLQHDIDAAAK